MVLYKGEILADGSTRDVLTNDTILHKASLILSPLTTIARKIHEKLSAFPNTILTLNDLNKEFAP